MAVSVTQPRIEFLHANEVSAKVKEYTTRYRTVNMAVAYFKQEGFESLREGLHLKSARDFGRSGLTLNLLVGLAEAPFFLTDARPLKRILKIRSQSSKAKRKRLQVRYYAKKQFHPKMILFEGNGSIASIVGSSNATGGGLLTNTEANALYEVDSNSAVGKKTHLFFKRLWTRNGSKGPVELTEERLETYDEHKHGFQKRQRNNGSGSASSLPTGSLPSNPKTEVTNGKDPILILRSIEYPLSTLRASCVSCGKFIPIPKKWLDFWECDDHKGSGKFILRTDHKAKPRFSSSEKSLIHSPKVEGICYHSKRGGICGKRIDYTPDFTHMLCQSCYNQRLENEEPAARIPSRRRLSNSMFYNRNLKDIYKGRL